MRMALATDSTVQRVLMTLPTFAYMKALTMPMYSVVMVWLAAIAVSQAQRQARS